MNKQSIKNITLTLLLTLLFSLSATAQAFVPPCVPAPYTWQRQDQDRAIRINRYSENGITFFVADVQITQPQMFKTAYAKGFHSLSDLALDHKAVFAVNADDYGAHKYGIIIRNGELLRARKTTRDQLLVDKNGDFSVRTERRGEKSASLAKQFLKDGIWQSFEFGPELVRDGQAVAFKKGFDLISTSPTRLEPRTGIGQIGPLHYVVIVVDGRQGNYSSGISLQDFQQLFVRFGAKTAFNLDGGGSSEMWFEGQILNRPSGGKERKMSDILFF